MRIGAAWGLGHSATLFLVGGAIVLFGLTVPPRLGLAFEMLVALMLIGSARGRFPVAASAARTR